MLIFLAFLSSKTFYAKLGLMVSLFSFSPLGKPADRLYIFISVQEMIIMITRNTWQSLAYSPLGAVVSPPSEY